MTLKEGAFDLINRQTFSQPIIKDAILKNMLSSVNYRMPDTTTNISAERSRIIDGAYDFALDLVEHRVFALPSTSCWFQTCISITGNHVAHLGLLAFNLVVNDDVEQISFVGFRTAPELGNDRIMLLGVGTFIIDEGWDGWKNLSHVVLTVTRLSEEQTSYLVGNIAGTLMWFVGLLNFKGLETETHPSKALATARARAKKPPLPTYIIVKVPKVSTRRSMADIASGRSSPRPHYRRGHIRNVGGAFVPVRPSFVLGGATPRSYAVVAEE